ncbi:hypothetical protein MIND_00551800 [Mycena indigotica]|uniref:Uncharacterized protein n=1 Tax=Mycena indigotica TaxID=2126181 RepID=A0A8H6T154_9AGAR|nr:uncharacterized protein MIND_00551800 [Mycena indigotica]KAF7307570.1 hypothetical protein MIND_00551800 [Mycena indigotica]
MDVRSRGTLLTSAGLLYASIGFTLSVLSTFLRLLWPFHGTRDDPTKALSMRRRSTIHRKHKRRSSIPPTLTNPSNSSSEESPSPENPRRHPTFLKPTTRRARSRSLERTVHNRNNSVRLGRSELRVPPETRNGHRRSESTPPTPFPRQWSFPEQQTSLAPPELQPPSIHHERGPSVDSTHSHLSFLQLPKKLKRSTSIISTETCGEKRRSQLLGPLLHKRKASDARRWSGISFTSVDDEGDTSASSPDAVADSPRHSIDTRQSIDHLPVPKRSQTLRTRPYEAPYFFPVPGSTEAEEYVPPLRPRPSRSGTLPVDRPLSGVF